MATNVQLIFETDAKKSLVQQKKLKDDLRSVEKTAKDSQEKVRSEFNKTANIIKKVSTVLGVTFGAAIIMKGLKDTLRTLKEFEVGLAGLRSITGMAAEDMVFMKDKAIELSKASTRSAKEVVEAFKLVGSAKPELLKSASALAEVTKQAIILAEAGGITVPEAAMALTGALNMFGKSAKDAAEFTDILATSQQKGSAFIASLAEAMINAGSVASALGMSFETTNAILQGFAKGGLQGSRAGMAFSIVMNKLANQADKSLNPAYTDTNQLLDNLAAKNLTVEQASKLVGEEASKYLLTLIKQRGIVQELNGTLSEHGNALEQARINTDTLDTSMKNVGKAWDNFILSVKTEEGVLNTALRNIAENITLMIESLTYEYKPGEGVADVLNSFKQGIKDLEKEAKAEAVVNYMINLKKAIAEIPGEKDWEEQILRTNMTIQQIKKEQEFNEKLAKSYRLMYDELERYLSDVRSGADIIDDFDDGLIPHKKTVAELAKEYKTLFDTIKAGLEDAREAKEGDAEADKIQAEWIFDIIDKEKKARDEAGKAEREAAERRMEQEEEDRKTRVELTEAELEKKKEAEIKADEEKRKLKEEIIRAGFEVASGFTDFLAAKNRNAMEEELAAAGDNEKKKDEIKRKYARKDQNISVIRAIISGAESIAKTYAEYGFTPVGIAAAIGAALVTGLQIATIKAQKFATGTLDLRGRGTGTSDSIPAMLSKGESVMTAKETSEYFPYLKAMKEGSFFRFQEEMIDKMAFKAVTNNNLNYDNSKEIKELKAINEQLRKNRESEYIDGKYRIIKKGNITTRISLN